eukprot:TRINITY_DN53070_c0_g1_i1.p1 TRINITY_DN53070_c0_g1~~TRINITY_DN53070_c0_g1_i1.p1  ORF type:complete len:234 (+),score=73.41 TRINITY_DN53070_c0_g1_i1:53-703(+)
MDRTLRHIELEHPAVGCVRVEQGSAVLQEGHDATARWVWDAASPFAEWICENKSLLEGKRVAEVGAGTGLVGIVAAKLGAREVVLTDLPTELPLLQRNAELNGVTDTVAVRPCSWGDAEHMEALGKFDVVLVSDCLYGRDSEVISMLLLQTLQSLCAPGGSVLLAYCYRENLMADLQFFEEVEETFDSKRHDLPKNRIRQGVESHELWLIEYTPKP